MTITYVEGKKMTILFSNIVALISDFLILFMLHKSINLEVVKAYINYLCFIHIIHMKVVFITLYFY